MGKPKTVGELRKAGYRIRSVKEELRHNLIERIQRQEPLFPGIIGYDRTAIPQLENAILSKHDFILLGLRGQAKSRILRQLVNFLDEEIPVIKGCPINDNPFEPVCVPCQRLRTRQGDGVEIEWLPREARYQEKLATPDVTIADLIGDIDPIKAARERLDFSDEAVIHYGIIPRTNRGIFAINELPDLPPRIQVGLLNILEEKDIQIRGFPLRIPLDVLIVSTANPEDYTNRGNLITPLKDRIGSQIVTHYPLNLEDAMAITAQEAWSDRGLSFEVPYFFREIIEEVAIEARKSEFVDQSSGVSARLAITAYENLLSNMERRGFKTGEKRLYPRICDLIALLPAITGKIELVYEGEQEGPTIVATNLVGKGVKKVFNRYFPPVHRPKGSSSPENPHYKRVAEHFSGGRTLEISDEMNFKSYFGALNRVAGLREVTAKYMRPKSERELAAAMEFVLEGLHQHNVLAKESLDSAFRYTDVLATVLRDMERE
ncbi:MAG: sigma 54-interacting transcriptional regulator [bacterium]